MQNRFEVVIKTIKEAEEIVDAFLKRVNRKYDLLNENNLEKNANIKKQSDDFNTAEFNKKLMELNSEKKFQLRRIVKKIETKRLAEKSVDTHKSINANGYHSNALTVFFNNQTPMKKNINGLKQEQLFTAYCNQDFTNEIFRDPDLLRISVGLFDNDKIRDPEFETIFIINNARKPLDKKYLPVSEKEFYPIQYYRILDENNEFTEDAKNILLKSLNANYKYLKEDWTNEKIQNFKLIMQAMIKKFPSENTFFTVKSQEYNFDEFAIELAQSSAVLYHGKCPKQMFDDETSSAKEKIYLSSSVDHALLLSCHHVDDVVFIRAMAGNLTTFDIERGVEGEVGLRPGAVIMADVDKNPNVHIYSDEVSDATKYDHDRYHAQLQTRIGNVIRLGQERIRLLARTQILKHSPQFEDIPLKEISSAAIWTHTDSELGHFNNPKRNRPKCYKDVVHSFLAALQSQAENSSNKTSTFFNIVNDGLTDDVTDLGVIWFIDLVKMKAKFWEKIHFDPDDFPRGAYERHYKIAEKIQKYFKYDMDDPDNPSHSKYNIFIFRIYLALGPDHFESFMTAFSREDRLSSLLKDQQFHRNNEKKFMGLVDKNQRSQTLASTVWIKLLRLLPIPNAKWNEQLDYKKYHSLFRATMLINLYGGDFYCIQSKVLLPLYRLISTLLETGKVEPEMIVNQCCRELDMFISYHRQNKTEEKASDLTLKQLEEITKRMQAYYGTPPNNVYKFSKEIMS